MPRSHTVSNMTLHLIYEISLRWLSESRMSPESLKKPPRESLSRARSMKPIITLRRKRVLLSPSSSAAPSRQLVSNSLTLSTFQLDGGRRKVVAISFFYRPLFFIPPVENLPPRPRPLCSLCLGGCCSSSLSPPGWLDGFLQSRLPLSLSPSLL